MKSKVIQIDGEFWFTASYAASLLTTTRKKIEAMAVRELIRSIPVGNSCFVAEADVTRLRRDAKALSAVKEAARLPRDPGSGVSMPRDTKYVGDRMTGRFKAKGPVGNPLADQGKR